MNIHSPDTNSNIWTPTVTEMGIKQTKKRDGAEPNKTKTVDSAWAHSERSDHQASVLQLHWLPQDHERRGQPINTWKWALKKDMTSTAGRIQK